MWHLELPEMKAAVIVVALLTFLCNLPLSSIPLLVPSQLVEESVLVF